MSKTSDNLDEEDLETLEEELEEEELEEELEDEELVDEEIEEIEAIDEEIEKIREEKQNDIPEWLDLGWIMYKRGILKSAKSKEDYAEFSALNHVRRSDGTALELLHQIQNLSAQEKKNRMLTALYCLHHVF